MNNRFLKTALLSLLAACCYVAAVAENRFGNDELKLIDTELDKVPDYDRAKTARIDSLRRLIEASSKPATRLGL